jgi:hypothetical protein
MGMSINTGFNSNPEVQASELLARKAQRALLFCWNLPSCLNADSKFDQWLRIAYFIETKLPRFVEQNVHYLDSTATGEFRSIRYFPHDQSVCIELLKEDLPDSFYTSRRANNLFEWTQDATDPSRLNKMHLAVRYDLHAPCLRMCFTQKNSSL